MGQRRLASSLAELLPDLGRGGCAERKRAHPRSSPLPFLVFAPCCIWTPGREQRSSKNIRGALVCPSEQRLRHFSMMHPWNTDVPTAASWRDHVRRNQKIPVRSRSWCDPRRRRPRLSFRAPPFAIASKTSKARKSISNSVASRRATSSCLRARRGRPSAASGL